MRYSFTEVMGAQTRYLHAGKGPNLLLVHGTGLTADSWYLNIPRLAQHFTVYAPDLLDNGFTEAGPYTGGAPQPLCVEHLIGFADKLGIERFALLGSSFGCNIATLLHDRIPDRIESLVLVGPGSALDRPGGDWRNMYKGAYLNGLKAFERRMSGIRLEAAIRDYEIRSRLEHIRVPTLVLLGRQDPRGNFDQACESAKLSSDGALLAYDQCGHWPHIEHPDRFNQDVVKFLLAKSGSQLLQGRAT